MDSNLDDYRPEFWQEVNAKIREARADVATSRVFDGEEVMKEILRKLEDERTK